MIDGHMITAILLHNQSRKPGVEKIEASDTIASWCAPSFASILFHPWRFRSSSHTSNPVWARKKPMMTAAVMQPPLRHHERNVALATGGVR
jgi:hypothetical protein